MIFKMDCYKVNGLPVILFWPNMQSEGRLMAKRLNNLLECKKSLKESYPLLLALFTLTWACSSLKDSYTQFMRGDSSDEDERIPLNDDQKQKLKDYFERLQIILEDICNNLSDICKNLHDNTIHAKFKNNFNVLQKHLEEFTQFVDPIFIDLKAKIQKFQKEKNDRSINAGVSAAITVGAFSLAYFLPAGRVFLKGASCAVGVASGGYAIYNGIKIYKLWNIINEHEQVRDVINDTQKFLEGTRDYVDIFDLNDLEDQRQPLIILHQFKHFRDEVRKLRSKLLSICQ
ncbi:hypothetical protein RhiirA4_441153 [Rhizophagus irregularis]|uniref:Uncharacterized protein n=1 Tax=Rhizophagus irregularis TaxID=588596 RepID=A0A2I1G3I6_9GLOM|nr:hypothetical protein RhiirA4_441153 [Rhizophagus irregularis]